MRHILQVPPDRDHYTRPVMDGIAHTRTSTIGSSIQDQYPLISYNGAHSALGVARSPELSAKLALLKYPAEKREIYKLAERARERAGAMYAAEMGDVIHEATFLADQGEELEYMPDYVVKDVAAYQDTMAAHGLTPEVGEVFCGQPDILVAGSFDRVMRQDDELYVLDIKTSRQEEAFQWNALSWATQVAIYANSTIWCKERGYIPWETLGIQRPSRKVGLIAHIVQGSGVCTLYRVDLEEGWRAALVAMQVHKLRAKAKTFITVQSEKTSLLPKQG